MKNFTALKTIAALALMSILSLGFLASSTVSVEAKYGGNPCTPREGRPLPPRCREGSGNIDINLGNISNSVVIVVINSVVGSLFA